MCGHRASKLSDAADTGDALKSHANYCQDPKCPARWEEDECANGSERRPKVGERVRIKTRFESHFGAGTIVRLDAEGFWAVRDDNQHERSPRGPYSAEERGTLWYYDDEPVSEPTKPAADGMGKSCSTCGVVDRNDPRGMNCSNGFHAPTAEMLSEREQEAWEIYLAGDMAAFPASRPPKRTPTIAAFSLAARDRAEAIFTAKSEERVKRVEQERDEARADANNEHKERVKLGRLRDAARAEIVELRAGVEVVATRAEVEHLRGELIPRLQAELTRANEDAGKWAATAATARADATRLAGLVDELVAALRDGRACNDPNCEVTTCVRTRLLLARIHAERKGKAESKPAINVSGENHPGACVCSWCSFIGFPALKTR